MTAQVISLAIYRYEKYASQHVGSVLEASQRLTDAIERASRKIVPEGYESSVIGGFVLTVHRGERAGQTFHYRTTQREAARRFADRLDREYGAICCTVKPVYQRGG